MLLVGPDAALDQDGWPRVAEDAEPAQLREVVAALLARCVPAGLSQLPDEHWLRM